MISGTSWVSQFSAAAATQSTLDWISTNSSDGLSSSLGLKKSAILRDFISNGEASASAFASIAQTQLTGLANLAAQAGITRARTQAADKIDALLSGETTVPSSIDGNALSRIDLANGSTLDLTANTFTLRDGRVLDITTGRTVDKLA